MATLTIDASGKKCPMPVLMAKKELKNLAHGDILTLISDDSGALKDIPALVNKIGDELLETIQEGGKITFKIRKN